MALSLEVTFYGENGEELETRLFGSLNQAKTVAKELNAVGMVVYDAEEDQENHYLMGGVRKSWLLTEPRLFERQMNRFRSKR
jgi:hypothetical protein